MAIQRVMMTDSRKEDVFYEEAIKTLRTNMQFSGVETKSIVITSCYPNEGKSDVAFQLAVEIGKMGKRVLIIDADIRKSSYTKGTEKLPFFLKWKFFFYIFSIFFRKSTKKLWLTP